MKNIKFKFIASALMSVALVGCNDMDTEPMGSTITSDQKEEAVAVNPERIEASVSAVSSMFYQYGNILGEDYHYDFGYPAIMMIGDHRGTDLVSDAIGFNWFSYGVDYTDISATAPPTRLVWGTSYKQIYACNSLISIVDPNTTDKTLKYYLAQALAVRAFDYFTLAQLYQKTYVGNQDKPCVPLILDTNANEAAANGCARASVDSTYKCILADLDKAIALLEDAESTEDGTEKVARADKRYVNAAVAYGLRARVNLVMNKWAEAAADADKAITLFAAEGGRPYSIAEVSKPGFSVITDASWMWGIKTAETDRVVTTGICNFPSHMGSLNYGYASVGAWRKINMNLFNLIPATDVRKGWFLNANSQSANLDEEQVWYVGYASIPAYTQVKFGCYKDEVYTSTNANDIPLMRVEEMYLIKAEAMAMNNDVPNAVALLKSFVSTYRNPGYSVEAASAKDVQEAVWLQRRIELWGEGFSYQDIQRLKKGVDRRGSGFSSEYVYNIPAEDDVFVYPIPMTEIEANAMLDASTNPVLSAPQPVAE